ncbi:hypothetical protein B0H10DRAFT_2218029 [Mycena sp. CBHHK59/15]|nr:hypothetical protein B0H10DRAFT_2218029 [Mycena sp. CBHHK59/15]
MTHIKVFLVGAPIDLSALIHLGGLETLHTFQATLPTSISIPEPPKGTLFSNMHEVTLGIEGGGIPAATNFGCVVPQHLEDFHGVLGTHCRLDTLKKFNLCLWDKSPGCLYPGHLLTSLILFHNLTVLYISAYEGYEITDEIVSSLARAWPQLEEFHLTSTVQSRHPPRATLLAIRALARHCPNLRALEMTFDAINVPPKAPLAIRQRSLPQLDVVFSPITDPRPVGEFLSGIFAELREITTQDFSTTMLWANTTMLASSFGNPQPTP